ncbi:class I lanthipeptide [Chitinophaga nivalis]|uniref:Class I lanthipeptide n=1 Tax=Chitinophaga nivalis TaxID=2991709 RepID=A0ABT3ILF2_9BACT|nr:class I lanthipeptide [Chitinophaga nivalis]MCW3465543.1 class I lanthipeptide [Chitinophaga nivalis]MCW3484766.1 class I lanthipeptide [Chitinophaga nivalis]
MKTKKIILSRKLFLSKATVLVLHANQQRAVAGGAWTTVQLPCDRTVNLPITVLSAEAPLQHCKCCAS